MYEYDRTSSVHNLRIVYRRVERIVTKGRGMERIEVVDGLWIRVYTYCTQRYVLTAKGCSL